MKTQKPDKLMNANKPETKPDSAATSGRVQRLVRLVFSPWCCEMCNGINYKNRWRWVERQPDGLHDKIVLCDKCASKDIEETWAAFYNGHYER